MAGAIASIFQPAEAQSGEGVETLTGTVTVTNPMFLDVFSDTYMLLLDMTAYVERDRNLAPSRESQIIAPVEGDLGTGAAFALDLPAAPQGTVNDLDQGQGDGSGVQLYSLEFSANLVGDRFIGPQEGGGWGEAMSSLEVTVGDGDVVGGKVIVWAPDDQQKFSTGLGPDGIFLTDDDPVVPIAAGWTVVDLDESTFSQVRTAEVEVPIIEGDDGFTDYGDRSFTEAFDLLFDELRLRYPFTELKGINWDALEAEYQPRVERAEAGNDVAAFNEAIFDFSHEFNDGHVGASLPEQVAAEALSGRLGMRLAETDDGDAIVISVTEGLPADLAGIELGAVVSTWNGQPTTEAVGEEPLLFGASTDHAKRLQQYEFLTRGMLGDEVLVQFRNPGGDEQTSELTFSEDIDDRDKAANTAISRDGLGEDQPPVSARELDSGLGYIKVSTFDADPLMMTSAWDQALEDFAANGAPGLIIDLRDNGGGIGETATILAGSFYDETFELSRLEFINANGENVDVGADEVIPSPTQWDAPVAVLVDKDCASACEIFAAAMAENPDHLIVGYTPSAGVEAGIYAWNLPGGVYFQASIERIVRDGEVFIEGEGVAPNVEVEATEENLLNPDDEVLLAAEDALNAAIAGAGTPEA
jgi:C-terminal processing protease CtpA/Prc